VLVDVGGHRDDRRSSSAPKKAAALFKISLARRSSRFSFSSSTNPMALFGREAGFGAAVDLGLGNPVAHRLVPNAVLSGDPADGSLPLAALLDGLQDLPDGAFFQL
jgi:hypothetical protein